MAVSKNRVPYVGVLINKGPTIQGTISGSPICGNPHMGKEFEFEDNSLSGILNPKPQTLNRKTPNPKGMPLSQVRVFLSLRWTRQGLTLNPQTPNP